MSPAAPAPMTITSCSFGIEKSPPFVFFRNKIIILDFAKKVKASQRKRGRCSNTCLPSIFALFMRGGFVLPQVFGALQIRYLLYVPDLAFGSIDSLTFGRTLSLALIGAGVALAVVGTIVTVTRIAIAFLLHLFRQAGFHLLADLFVLAKAKCADHSERKHGKMRDRQRTANFSVLATKQALCHTVADFFKTHCFLSFSFHLFTISNECILAFTVSPDVVFL
jgi:hypothetical protein